MKELSTEEKAKRYDEAIEIARQIHDADRVSGIELTTCEEIFPELKESEDERIRQEIIYHIQNCDDTIDEETGKRMLAWLEKQGEIIKEWSEMKINNILTELQDMVDLKQKTEQGEQKPYASETYEESLAWLKKQRPSGCPEYCVMSNCANCPYRPVLIKKPNEWSEEDKKMSRFIGNAITTDDASIFLESKDIQVIDAHVWLDRLKDRIQPQSQQDWSMYDETILKTLIDHFEYKKEFNEAEDYDIVLWLKSLRPQNRWKPSDELLDVFIKNATDFFESNFNPLTDGGVIGAFDDKEGMIEEFKEYMKEEGFNEEWI